MNKVMFAGLVSSLALLGGCSSMQIDKNDSGIMVEEGMTEIVDSPGRSDSIPNWYIDLPNDSSDRIYGSGSGLSSDLQFSLDKALHQAKIVLGDKMSNTVSSEIKTYMSDNSSVGSGITVEETQRVSKSGFKDVDISKYNIENKEVFKEDTKFRAYILLSLDPRGRNEKPQDNVATPVEIEAIKQAQDNARATLNDL